MEKSPKVKNVKYIHMLELLLFIEANEFFCRNLSIGTVCITWENDSHLYQPSHLKTTNFQQSFHERDYSSLCREPFEICVVGQETEPGNKDSFGT